MNTAEILKSRKGEICERWLRKVREKIPQTRNYEKTAIENSVPDLIESIIKILTTGDSAGIKSHSIEHGWQRTRETSYSMVHIIREYNLLRSEIFKVIDSIADNISHHDRDIVINAIDYAIENSAEAFFKAHQEIHVDARRIAEIKADRLQVEDKNREEFIQAIMHDLSSPLNNIKACTEMLENGVDVDTAQQLIEIIKASSSQAGLLIEDFLDISSVDYLQVLPTHKMRINVVEEVKQQINVFEISYRKEFILSSDADEIYAELDIELIRRALNNLMENAIKHGNPSDPVEVECKSMSGRLIIEVRNTGKEIPGEILESIFKRYYKTGKNTKGWGIGLAFVRKVAEAHNGRVFVESNKHGTIFKIDLPIKSQH